MASVCKNINIGEYYYQLPDERVARYPLSERDTSKLLLWNGKVIRDSVFRELPFLLNSDSLLVFNNTRVIRARLIFKKDSGAVIEIFCLEPAEPHDISLNLLSSSGVEWRCLIGNLKRWKSGRLKGVFMASGKPHTLYASRISSEGDAFRIRFEWDDEHVIFSDILETIGHVPIPPYLGRDDDESDIDNYQTVYASIAGSVAAPTAGLHFTPDLIKELDREGIKRMEVTLHVSAGTFRPVKTEMVSDHRMHTEHFFIKASAIKMLRHNNNIIAVGTTTVRTLESLYWLGAAISDGREPLEEIPAIAQWEPYDHDSKLTKEDALDIVLQWMNKMRKEHVEMEVMTDIIIVPGYRFRVVNGLVTNFHQPGSTLLLLVAAFTGEAWKEIYDHALSSGYRFLSYGDSMFLTHPLSAL